jgi:hypothetical protein
MSQCFLCYEDKENWGQLEYIKESNQGSFPFQNIVLSLYNIGHINGALFYFPTIYCPKHSR